MFRESGGPGSRGAVGRETDGGIEPDEPEDKGGLHGAATEWARNLFAGHGLFE